MSISCERIDEDISPTSGTFPVSGSSVQRVPYMVLLVCYPSCGMSVMEMSHRSKMFENILEQAKADLKELMLHDRFSLLKYVLRNKCLYREGSGFSS